MGGAAKTIGRVGSGVFTLGGSEIARNNLSDKNVIRNALGAPGTILTGGLAGRDQMPLLFGGGGGQNPNNGDPFYIDPAQIAADKDAIVHLGQEQSKQLTDLGQNQYSQYNDFITGDQASRDAARQRLGEALTKQNQAFFQQGLPATEETLNAQHLLNGSGLGQEIARQQGTLATNIANEVGATGARDYDYASQQRAAALQGLLGSQSQALAVNQGAGANALSRGFSLEDFIRSANVAKTIGAQAAPQVGNGKGNMVGGLGAGAAAGAPFGPYGAAIGGGAGALLGGAGKGR